MNKNDVISEIMIMKPDYLNLVKASQKNGGGFLNVKSQTMFDKIMLRRSRNYASEDDIPTDYSALYDTFSWFRVKEDDLLGFQYVLFAIVDDGKVYPLIFSVEEIKKLISDFSVDKTVIDIYIYKRRNTQRGFEITRFGKVLETPYPVSKNYQDWDSLN